MQTTRESQSVKVIKRRLVNVFRNVAAVVFNSKLSATLSATTRMDTLPLFYKQAAHPFESHQFLDLFSVLSCSTYANKCIHIFSGHYSNISHLK